MFQGFNAAWIVKYSERNLWGEMYKTSLYYALNDAVIGDDDNFRTDELQKAVRLRDECLRVKSVAEAKQAWVNYEKFCFCNKSLYIKILREEKEGEEDKEDEEDEETGREWRHSNTGQRRRKKNRRRRRTRRRASVNDELDSIIELLLILTNVWYVGYILSPHANGLDGADKLCFLISLIRFSQCRYQERRKYEVCWIREAILRLTKLEVEELNKKLRRILRKIGNGLEGRAKEILNRVADEVAMLIDDDDDDDFQQQRIALKTRSRIMLGAKVKEEVMKRVQVSTVRYI
jgi:hypothetical protein